MERNDYISLLEQAMIDSPRRGKTVADKIRDWDGNSAYPTSYDDSYSYGKKDGSLLEVLETHSKNLSDDDFLTLNENTLTKQESIVMQKLIKEMEMYQPNYEDELLADDYDDLSTDDILGDSHDHTLEDDGIIGLHDDDIDDIALADAIATMDADSVEAEEEEDEYGPDDDGDEDDLYSDSSYLDDMGDDEDDGYEGY